MSHCSNRSYLFFFLMIRRPPRSTLFPYTRSSDLGSRESIRQVPIRKASNPAARSLSNSPCVQIPDSLTAMQFSGMWRSEEHTSELQSQSNLVCRLLLEKKKCTHYS